MYSVREHIASLDRARMALYAITFAALNVFSLIAGSLLLLFAGTYIFTLIRFQLTLRTFQNEKGGQNLQAPPLPIAIPWLGNARSFLTTEPHGFWKRLFSWLPQSTGACAMLMGGEHATVIYNAPSVQYIMKDRKMGRDNFTEMIARDGLGVTKPELVKFFGHNTGAKPGEVSSHELQDRMNLEYLLKADRVNELTQEFSNTFQRDLAHQFESGPEEVELYKWLRGLMFTASTTALWGNRVLELIPDLDQYFFQFDQDMLYLFFRIPRFWIPQKYKNRDAAIEQLCRWYDVANTELGGKIPDPEEVAWEPCYGSRLSRARQVFFRKLGLEQCSMASFELGFLFGLSSNAIPATGWMLTYIIDSVRPENKAKGETTLYEYILAEVNEAVNADGTLNIALLINQPILQSTLNEVLRSRVDVLVSRQVTEGDVTLPLPPASSVKSSQRSLLVKKGSLIMMPSYLAHNDPTAWQYEFPHHPPPEVFYPYRFLTTHPADTAPGQRPKFTTAHTTGSFFPFGGGKTMCPGRTFAKQEMLAAVAMVLLTFEFEFVNFVDEKRRTTDKFPGLRDTFPGSAVMVASGDVRVRMKRRDRRGAETAM